MRGREIALVSLAVAVLAGGCGTSETKRAVDPRIEVLRFFAPDTALVGLLRTDRLGQVSAIDAAVSSLPGYEPIVARLRQAGLTTAELRRLVKGEENEEGIGPPELAIGASGLDALDRGRALLALDTGDEARLSRRFREFASRESLAAAGEHHDADLYAGRGAAFAVRDGVLVAGADLDQVRSALEIRDGDRDQQLDDGEVGALFDELPEGAPLHVYADFGALIEPDRAVSALAEEEPWLGAIGEGALSVGAVGTTVELDAFARLDEESLGESELPADEEFAPFSLSPEAIGLLLPSNGAAPLRSLMLAMAPIAGDASASSDELRIRVLLAP
jgi:hypothetical protein